jgi:hypothetical protein
MGCVIGVVGLFTSPAPLYPHSSTEEHGRLCEAWEGGIVELINVNLIVWLFYSGVKVAGAKS